MYNFIFLDDILRKDYKRDRLTVYRMIEASLKVVFDKEIEYYQKNQDNYFIDVNKFLKLAQYDETDSQFWVKHYYKLPPEAEEYLVQNMPKDAIYFSYEAPEWLEDIMLKYEFKYIFLRMSYIRYLSDIPMLISSNIPEVIDKVKSKYKFKQHEIIFETDLFKSMIFHNLNRPNIMEKYTFLDNSLVILGQTDFDASLKNKDKPDSVIRLYDYKDELINKFENFSTILYKPHPYAKKEHVQNEFDLLKDISKGNINKINTNVYEMFSLPFNTAFLGLTSGSLREAQYFGKDSGTLAPFPFEMQENNNSIHLINVKAHYIYSPKFWEDILGNYSKVIHSFENYHPEIPNLTRNLCAVSWNYGKLLSKHYITIREPIDEKIKSQKMITTKPKYKLKDILLSKTKDEKHTILRIAGIKISYKSKERS